MFANWREWTVFHMLFFVTFLVSGLVVNLLQAVLFIIVGWRNRTLFRKLNYYLMWTIYAQLLFLANWWSGSRLRIHASREMLENIGREHAVCVMNHHYENDWMIAFMAADHGSSLGNARVIAKKMLRFVPVVGWAWNFSDIVYLDRSWEKDRLVIAEGIKNLANYPDPMMLLLFAEGTRFSPDKHRASLEFAKERGLPELKHHLIPRVKGFAETMRNLDTEKVRYLYDVTAAVDEKRGSAATLSNVLTGKKMVAELYIRRIPSKEVAGEKSEEAMSRWLMNLYAEKDALKDNYINHGSFTRDGADSRFENFEVLEVKPRPTTLIVMVTLNLIVGCPLVKGLFGAITSDSLTQISMVGTVSIILYVGLRKMIGLTKISKASAYGAKKEQ